VQGAVTTAAPAYTTAQTDPLSLTTAGALRADLNSIAGTTIVNGGLAGSQSVGGPSAANGTYYNPIPGGGQGLSAEPSVVTTTKAVQDFRDLSGKEVIQPYAAREQEWRGYVSISAGVGTVIAANAGLKTYITGLQCWNTSGTTVTVTLTDSASTVIICPAGGGNNLTFPVPLATSATNTAITATPSTNQTNVSVSAQGYYGY
jgi:hypothetical protein